jgi:hypothetical protein
MAVTVKGLLSAEKDAGNLSTGTKKYIVQSDSQITDDVDLIIDAAGLPLYDDIWSVYDTTGLRVRNKRARAIDDIGGYVWEVTVEYEVPTAQEGQDDLNPVDRDWDWSVAPNKKQIAATQSLFTPTDYQFIDSLPDENVNLAQGKALQNTANSPIVGLQQNIVQQAITLSKYVNDATDLGVLSWELLDLYVDTVNSDTKTILDRSLVKWTALMDSITYGPVSENGFDCYLVNFRILVDPYYTHVASVVSAGYQQLVSGKLVPIPDAKYGITTEPRPLDKDGKVIEQTGTQIKPVYINAGLNQAISWASLSLPSTIP